MIQAGSADHHHQVEHQEVSDISNQSKVVSVLVIDKS
jgi:hypothetical protein